MTRFFPALVFCLLLTVSISICAPICAPVFAQQNSISVLPEDLLHDGQALFTQQNAWWLLSGAVLTLVAVEIEDPDSVARSLDSGLMDFMADFGNVWGDMKVQGPLALGCWAAGSWSGNEEFSDLGYDLTRSLLITYAVTGVLKHSVQRTRPNGDDLSFPSGHTAAAFATAGVLSKRYGRWIGGVGIGLGVLTAAGRMEDRFHYASDVIAGATIGWIIGRTVACEKPLTVSGLQLVPAGSGLALVGNF